MTKIDRGSIKYADARDQALKIADKEKELQVVDVFSSCQWRIGWLGTPPKETMAYCQVAVDDLVVERELEIIKEYYGWSKGWVFRRAGILDRIVGAVDKDD